MESQKQEKGSAIQSNVTLAKTLKSNTISTSPANFSHQNAHQTSSANLTKTAPKASHAKTNSVSTSAFPPHALSEPNASEEIVSGPIYDPRTARLSSARKDTCA